MVVSIVLKYMLQGVNMFIWQSISGLDMRTPQAGAFSLTEVMFWLYMQATARAGQLCIAGQGSLCL